MRPNIGFNKERSKIYIEIKGDNVKKKKIKKIPETFEEEIKLVVEEELNNAAERIKKYLTLNNKKLSNKQDLKIQDKICEECHELIVGDIFKNVLDVEEKYYCEKCSFEIDGPKFIVH